MGYESIHHKRKIDSTKTQRKGAVQNPPLMSFSDHTPLQCIMGGRALKEMMRLSNKVKKLETIPEEDEESIQEESTKEAEYSKPFFKHKGSSGFLHEMCQALDAVNFFKIEYEELAQLSIDGGVGKKRKECLERFGKALDDVERYFFALQMEYPVRLDQIDVFENEMVRGALFQRLLAEMQEERVWQFLQLQRARTPFKSFSKSGAPVLREYQSLPTILSLSCFNLQQDETIDRIQVQRVFFSWIGQLLATESGEALLEEYYRLAQKLPQADKLSVHFVTERSHLPKPMRMEEDGKKCTIIVPWQCTEDWWNKVGDPEHQDFFHWVIIPSYLQLFDLLSQYLYGNKKRTKAGTPSKSNQLSRDMRREKGLFCMDYCLENPAKIQGAKLRSEPVFRDTWKSVEFPKYKSLRTQVAEKPEFEVEEEALTSVKTPAINFPSTRNFGAFEVLSPDIGFHKDQLDMRRIGYVNSGKHGAVVNVGTKDGTGKEFYLKLLNRNSQKDFYSKYPERESLASNLISVMGKRVAAPDSQVEPKGSETLRVLAHHAQRIYTEETRANPTTAGGSRKAKVSRVFRENASLPMPNVAVAMSKVPGHTIIDLDKMLPNDEVTKAVLRHPKVLAALGELYVYDLILGNHDRLPEEIHESNVLFNVTAVVNGGRLQNLQVHEPALSAIDQSMTPIDLYIMMECAKVNFGPMERCRLGRCGRKRNITVEHVAFHDMKFLQYADELKIKEGVSPRLRGFAMDQYRRLAKEVKAFLHAFVNGKSAEIVFNKYFVDETLREKANAVPLDIGFVEGLLNLISKGSIIQSLQWMNMPGFMQEVEMMVQGWAMIRDAIEEVGYDEIVMKLSEMRQKFNDDNGYEL
ncbi:hypothetical protein [Aureibacter tunicatorum]|uniref:Uncharacterized protein n=1 Tax=Aureibacter tunicatorum TaxID=866807 RepID=A0AAE3XJ65_9BACT|nr:hypothetical protein [Aureibacter tunicatorum]MDR6237119.1 hypothetical protein [Aureibacter tunicatorum]BDD06111.1 hypothetical protein AUTU_35940 [Aureibacter tunicatorum]